MPAPEPSIEELRSESERARAALAVTVGQLRDKVGDTTSELKTLLSPAHIKKEIKDYIREERESLVQSLQRKAKDNPLQAAAVGAALAYPAWNMLRAIPTPLILIGAGLFLTSSRGKRAAEDIKSKVDDAVQQGTEKVSELAGSVKSDLQDHVAGARAGIEKVNDAATSKAGAVADKANRAIHDATDAVQSVSAVGMAAYEEGVASATTASADIKDQATAVARDSRKAAADLLKDNPLLVAGIAVAVGAFIAASLPSSEAENRLFGADSDKLKNKARKAAADGLDKAGEFAAQTTGSVAAAAAREGLDSTGVQHALNKVADSVRAVADRGLNTAVGATPQPVQQSMSERNAT